MSQKVKSSEVRLGNWLCHENGTEFQVDLKTLAAMDVGLLDGYPLTLSRYWLEAAGLEAIAPGTWSIYPIKVVQQRLSSAYTATREDTPVCKLRYVHSLQNLVFELSHEEIVFITKPQTS